MTTMILRKRVLHGGLAAALLASTMLGALQLASTGAVASEETFNAGEFDRGYADLAERILPSVVNVSVTREMEQQEAPFSPDQRRFFEKFFGPGSEGPKEHSRQPMRGEGSGFIIDASGVDAEALIVTNAHVVKGATEITVSLQDGRKIEAKLRGIDEKTDLALLELEDGEGLKPVRFADSDRVRVGDKVLAVGNPFGLGGTVTSGIVSATGRELGSGPYDDFLQLDAAINRGNSGGPTFNLDGDVIGVNSMIFSPSGGNVGIGFAISANLAREVIADLADDGMIERGWLGVSIQPLSDNLAEALGLDDTKGALVSSVVAGSPAASAGLQEGDVIQRFDGEEIEKPSTLSKIVASREPDSENAVQVWRDGRAKELTVELGILDDQAMVVASAGNDELEAPKLGLTLSPLDDEQRQSLGLEDDRTGVVISSVAPGSPAERQDMLPGDIILSIDNKPVATPVEVSEIVDAARQEGRNAVAILMARDGQQLFKALTLAAS